MAFIQSKVGVVMDVLSLRLNKMEQLHVHVTTLAILLCLWCVFNQHAFINKTSYYEPSFLLNCRALNLSSVIIKLVDFCASVMLAILSTKTEKPVTVCCS